MPILSQVFGLLQSLSELVDQSILNKINYLFFRSDEMIYLIRLRLSFSNILSCNLSSSSHLMHA